MVTAWDCFGGMHRAGNAGMGLSHYPAANPAGPYFLSPNIEQLSSNSQWQNVRADITRRLIKHRRRITLDIRLLSAFVENSS